MLAWFDRLESDVIFVPQSFSDFLKKGPAVEGVPEKVVNELKEILEKARIKKGEMMTKVDSLMQILDLASKGTDITPSVKILKKIASSEDHIEAHVAIQALTWHYVNKSKWNEIIKLLNNKSNNADGYVKILSCARTLYAIAFTKKDISKLVPALVTTLRTKPQLTETFYGVEQNLVDIALGAIIDQSKENADKVIKEIKKQKAEFCASRLVMKYEGRYKFDSVPKKDWQVTDQYGTRGVNNYDGYLTWYDRSLNQIAGASETRQSYHDFLKNGPVENWVPQNMLDELREAILSALIRYNSDFERLEKQLQEKSKNEIASAAISISDIAEQREGRDFSRFIPRLVTLLKKRNDFIVILQGCEIDIISDALEAIINENEENAKKVIAEIKKQKAERYANKLIMQYKEIYKLDKVDEENLGKKKKEEKEAPLGKVIWDGRKGDTLQVDVYKEKLIWYQRTNDGQAMRTQLVSDFRKNGPMLQDVPSFIVEKINKYLDDPDGSIAISKKISDLDKYDAFPVAPNEANDAILVLLELMKGREYTITMKLLVKELKNQLKLNKEKKLPIMFAANGLMELFKKATWIGIDISPAVPDIKKYAKLDQFGKKDAEEALKEFASRKMKK